MPVRARRRMLVTTKGVEVPTWTDFADWIWISAMMIAWLLFIAVIGCVAVLASWRHTSSPGRHGRPKSA
jgi:hypothetical protein